jgi:flagellar basal body rod protein FlgB
MRNIVYVVVTGFILMNCCFAALEGALYDDTTVRLEGEIKNCVQQQGVIAHNIANADTDGYKPIRSAEEIQEIKARGTDINNDKVIVEEEMAKMTKNRIRHQSYLKIYNMLMQSKKTVISQGK